MRGLTYSKQKRTDKKKMPTAFDVVQAAQIGLQVALFREVKMSIPSANQMVEEAGKYIQQLFDSPEPAVGKSILFAVRPDPAKWMRINQDTPVASVDKELGSNIWLIVDVGYYVEKVCLELVRLNNQEGDYQRWKARLKTKQN